MAQILSRFGPSVLLLLTYVPNALYLLIFWLIVRKIPKVEWEKKDLSFRDLLKIFVMMYAISTVLNYLGAAISNAAPVGGTQQLDMINSIVNTRLIVGILIPTVIGPVVEELIFRKLMIDRLHQYGESVVIVFSALCFGLFHGNLTQFLFAGSVGLFLGYVYCKSGKIIYTIIMHILLNSFGSLIMLLLPLLEGGNNNAVSLLLVGFIGLIMATMMISGIVLIIRHLKKKDIVLDDSMPEAIPKNEVFKTVYLSPGVLLLFIISVAGIVMELLNISIPLPNQQPKV